MENNTNSYEKTYSYLLHKYKRATIGRKELAKELDISISTLDLYIYKKWESQNIKNWESQKIHECFLILWMLQNFYHRIKLKQCNFKRRKK